MAYTLKEFGGLALVGPAGPVPGGAAQRRSLALLAIIASGRARGVSRAKLTGLLWGHSDEDRARGALAQTLYRVRQTLGADAIEPLEAPPQHRAPCLKPGGAARGGYLG